MEKHLIKAVIFDMDGLLIDSEPFWRKAEIKAFAEAGVQLTEDNCKETMGYRLNEVVERWYSRKPWTGISLLEMESRILSLVSQYILKEGKPMPGVEQLIGECKANNLKIAIASSSPIMLINSVVKLFNMEGEFDVLHSAQNEPYGKPHPAVFISTAQMLGVEPHECMVLEDSFHGVVAALAAKMTVVAVPDAKMINDIRFNAATLTIKSLDKLDRNLIF